MGQAFDRNGNVLGEAFGDTKREVFDKLTNEFKDAHEIRIKSMVDQASERVYDPPCVAPPGPGNLPPGASLDRLSPMPGVISSPGPGSGAPPTAGPPLISPQRLSLDNVEHAFKYQPWNEDQQQRGKAVVAALIETAKVVIRNVPECPTRTRALNNLIDARMLANAAITHDGRY